MQVQFDVKSESELIRLAAFLAGGPQALCKVLGVTKPAFWQWVSKGKVPKARVTDLCEATGHRLKPWHIRPDLYRLRKRK